MRDTFSSLAAVRKVPALTATPTTAALVDRSVTPETVPDDMGTPKLIPPCEFEVQAQPMSSDSSLDTYVFSEPEVVLTSTTAIRLFQWLPDGHTWLIGRVMTGRAGEYIETFDLVTGEIKRYAERRSSVGMPIWLPSEQAVAFVDSMPPDYTRVLYLARGEGTPVEELAWDLANPLLSLTLDGQVTYSANTRGIQAIRLDEPSAVSVLIANLPGQSEPGWAYSDAWRTDGTMAAIYMYKQGILYLVDQTTGTICGMDLGQGCSESITVNASDMAWSADGRYLALRRVWGNPERFLSLRIIDTFAKTFRDITIEGRSVHGLDWNPNDDVLLIAVDADQDPFLSGFDRFYILDMVSYKASPILPEYQFWAAGYFGALWSPDGKTVGVACSDVVPPDEVIEWRVCLIDVETQQ